MSITVAARVTCFSVIPGAVPRGHPDPVVPATLLTDAPAEVDVTIESAEPVGMEITAAIIAMQNAVLDRDRSFTPWRVDGFIAIFFPFMVHTCEMVVDVCRFERSTAVGSVPR